MILVKVRIQINGFIPGIGNVADFINALWYFQQGDTLTAIISLVAMLPILGIISNLIFKGAGKAAGKFMKYLNETGITDVITNWLKHASNSLSDVFKGGKIDLSAKNMEKVNQFLGKTKQKVNKMIENILQDNRGSSDPKWYGEISEKALNSVKKKWGKKGVDAFEKAKNKGIVGAKGQNGVKKLTGKPLNGKYTHEIKVKNKEYGDYRIYGYQDDEGKMVFDHFDKGLH